MAESFGLEEVRRALAEDCARADVTTRLLGAAADRIVGAQFVAERRFVVAGTSIAGLVFGDLEPAAEWRVALPEGTWVEPGAVLAAVRAPASAILAGERVALNFLQRLSGIATLTRRAVEAVAGTGARITHTRKTTPGLRELERYAVRVGGGVDNRASLAEAVLWKDNHWVLAAGTGLPLARALAAAPPGVEVVVEVETGEQLETALAAGATHLLVDNCSPQRLAAWARRAGSAVTIQASGGITPSTARAYAAAGADLIAIGALTHSAVAAPIRMDLGLAT